MAENTVEKTLRRIGLFTLFLIASAVTICNVDWILGPFLTRSSFRLSLQERMEIVALVSFSGSIYMYWFARLMNKLICEYEKNGQTAEVLSNSSSWWDRRKAGFIRRHQKALHRDNIWVMRLRYWGIPVAIGIGIIPEVLPLARTTLITFFGVSRWRREFAVYLMADLIKNMGWSGLLSWILHH